MGLMWFGVRGTKCTRASWRLASPWLSTGHSVALVTHGSTVGIHSYCKANSSSRKCKVRNTVDWDIPRTSRVKGLDPRRAEPNKLPKSTKQARNISWPVPRVSTLDCGISYHLSTVPKSELLLGFGLLVSHLCHSSLPCLNGSSITHWLSSSWVLTSW